MDSPLSVLAHLADILEQQEITYVLVGSLASSMHGMYRSTADIDILADVKPQHVRPLLDALQDAFYIDDEAVRRAVDLHRSFNAIHFDSVFKVDIFIPKDEFGRKQLERRELRRMSADSNRMIFVATAEDTILAKLKWYLSGDKVSTQQWTDVVGIIGASSTTLDTVYLHQWAETLGVTDLLEQAFQETGEK